LARSNIIKLHKVKKPKNTQNPNQKTPTKQKGVCHCERNSGKINNLIRQRKDGVDAKCLMRSLHLKLENIL